MKRGLIVFITLITFPALYLWYEHFYNANVPLTTQSPIIESDGYLDDVEGYCSKADNVNPIDASNYDENIINQTKSIISSCSTNEEKAKAIFDWITDNIKYDKDLMEKASSLNNDEESVTAIGTLKNKSSICLGQAELFVSMCRVARIPVRLYEGKVNSFGKTIGHAWNGVFVNNKWIIVDITNDRYDANSNNYNPVFGQLEWK